MGRLLRLVLMVLLVLLLLLLLLLLLQLERELSLLLLLLVMLLLQLLLQLLLPLVFQHHFLLLRADKFVPLLLFLSLLIREKLVQMLEFLGHLFLLSLPLLLFPGRSEQLLGVKLPNAISQPLGLLGLLALLLKGREQ